MKLWEKKNSIIQKDPKNRNQKNEDKKKKQRATINFRLNSEIEKKNKYKTK